MSENITKPTDDLYNDITTFDLTGGSDDGIATASISGGTGGTMTNPIDMNSPKLITQNEFFKCIANFFYGADVSDDIVDGVGQGAFNAFGDVMTWDDIKSYDKYKCLPYFGADKPFNSDCTPFWEILGRNNLPTTENVLDLSGDALPFVLYPDIPAKQMLTHRDFWVTPFENYDRATNPFKDKVYIGVHTDNDGGLMDSEISATTLVTLLTTFIEATTDSKTGRCFEYNGSNRPLSGSDYFQVPSYSKKMFWKKNDAVFFKITTQMLNTGANPHYNLNPYECKIKLVNGTSNLESNTTDGYFTTPDSYVSSEDVNGIQKIEVRYPVVRNITWLHFNYITTGGTDQNDWAFNIPSGMAQRGHFNLLDPQYVDDVSDIVQTGVFTYALIDKKSDNGNIKAKTDVQLCLFSKSDLGNTGVVTLNRTLNTMAEAWNSWGDKTRPRDITPILHVNKSGLPTSTTYSNYTLGYRTPMGVWVDTRQKISDLIIGSSRTISMLPSLYIAKQIKNETKYTIIYASGEWISADRTPGKYTEEVFIAPGGAYNIMVSPSFDIRYSDIDSSTYNSELYIYLDSSLNPIRVFYEGEKEDFSNPNDIMYQEIIEGGNTLYVRDSEWIN